MKKPRLLKIFWLMSLSICFLCTIRNFSKSKKHKTYAYTTCTTWAVLNILVKLNNHSLISCNSIIYSPNQFSDKWCPYVSIVFIDASIYYSVKMLSFLTLASRTGSIKIWKRGEN